MKLFTRSKEESRINLLKKAIRCPKASNRFFKVKHIPRERSPPIKFYETTQNLIGGFIMFDNSNPYTIRTENWDGYIRHIVSFHDGQNIFRETEVSAEIAGELNDFIRRERNFRRWDERHLEQFLLSDEMVHKRVSGSSGGPEEIILRKELVVYLKQVINDLPRIQRYRFLFYFEKNLTYEQIAEMEGCTKQSVKASVDIARQKVIEKLKKFFD